MKLCPTCRKTYTDDGLNFCLEDGSVLVLENPSMANTIVMGNPMPTDPSPIGLNQQRIQSTYGTQPQYAAPVKKGSSKTWLIAVAILGLVLLICGGGLAGFFVYVVSQADTANINDSADPTPTPGSVRLSNVSASPTPFESQDVQVVDLSEWVREFSVYGTTEFTDDEFLMSSKQKGYYYVLVAPEEYKTENAVTRVTARNVDNTPSSLGFGLIFHSDTTPLEKDYAFLIDTKKKRFRVVRHEPSKETTVVPWTNSNFIKEGGADNILEARDKDSKVDLYINDQKVTSVTNTYGFKGGVAGLYSGDAVKAGFKDLEITKQ